MQAAALAGGAILGSVISGGFALGAQGLANQSSSNLADRAEKSYTSQGLPSYMAYGNNNVPTMRYQVSGQNIANSSVPFFVGGASLAKNQQQQASGVGRQPQPRSPLTFSTQNETASQRNFNLYGDIRNTNVKGTYRSNPIQIPTTSNSLNSFRSTPSTYSSSNNSLFSGSSFENFPSPLRVGAALR